ncbi:MAG: hypothetical protein GQ527_01500 [Bacteroidales bacterium]|nr:hypothetical protein [Bacteroidales bacterium]
MINIYSHKNSKRLQYILKLIFNELMGVDFELTTSKDEYESFEGIKLHYTTRLIDDGLFIGSKNILFETDIRHQDIQFVDFMGVSCPYAVYLDEGVFPFDIFAASFYLISRYEEYLPHKKDIHKRFIAKESLAYQKKFLNLPIINIWVKEFTKRIEEKYPEFQAHPKKYSFTPTYDIDIAWSYKNKGLTRNIGGGLRDLFQLNFNGIKERINVLYGQKQDPYDTYEQQKLWQKQYQLKPIYFFLFGELGPFDKSISNLNSNLQNLVKDLRDIAQIGIHPSYESNDDNKRLKKEIDTLSETVHIDITRSRQHFLKLNLPTTYRNLINLDIKHDYTMGYASAVGFRASIASSFFFYDLDLDTETKLRIHPFAIMDGTLKDYLKVDAESAKEIISNIIETVKASDGHMISLWHNESLSNVGRWKGWLDVYEHLLKEAQ